MYAYCNKCKSEKCNFGLKKKFVLILKYEFYTKNLLKNYIKIPTETFENQTGQYMI